MVKRYSVTEAQESLSDVLRDAEEGGRVELLEKGSPIAILLSIQEFERLREQHPTFWEAYQEFRRDFDPEQDGIDPDEVFGNLRDPGRDLPR
jgi:prevent-host-death family protein